MALKNAFANLATEPKQDKIIGGIGLINDTILSYLGEVDVLHVSGATGALILGVRNDSDAALTTQNLAHSPIATDAAGRVKITGPIALSGTSDVNLIQVGGAAISLGQALMVSSVPVVIASDQSVLTVTGTVSATQGTSPWVVSGAVDVTDAFLLDATFTSRINTLGQKVMASSTPVVIASDQSPIPITGFPATQTVAISQTGSNNDVDVLTVPAPLSTTGGGTEATALRVTIANDSTGLLSVDDNGGSLTVDATDLDIRNLLFASDKVDASGSSVSVSNFPATQAVSATNLDIRDIDKAQDDILIYANTAKDGTGTSYVPLVDTDGHLQVDILSGGGSAGQQYADGAARGTATGTLAMGDDGTNIQSIHVDSSGDLQVDILSVAGTVTVSATNLDIRDLTFAADKVDASGSSVSVSNFPATQPVSGTVTADTELPAAAALADNTANPTVPAVGSFVMVWDGSTWDRAPGTAVDGLLVNLGGNNDVTVTSGTVAATQSGTWVLGANSGVDIGDVTINNASGASAVNIQDGGNSITVDGSVSVSNFPATQPVSGTVTADTELPAAAALADNTANPTVPAVGSFSMLWDGSTWDRSPGNSSDGLLVNLGSNNDVTVTGSVTANAGTNLNTSALNLEATQADVRTALQIIDDWDETDRAKVNIIVGQAGVAGGSGTVGATTQRVTLATDVALPTGANSIGNVVPEASSSGAALQVARDAAVTNTAVAISATSGRLYGWHIFNPGTALAYLQIYNLAAASVSVGTTTPRITLAMPSNSSSNVGVDGLFSIPIEFGTAISMAATTTPTGGTAPATAVLANIFYRNV